MHTYTNTQTYSNHKVLTSNVRYVFCMQHARILVSTLARAWLLCSGILCMTLHHFRVRWDATVHIIVIYMSCIVRRYMCLRQCCTLHPMHHAWVRSGQNHMFILCVCVVCVCVCGVCVCVVCVCVCGVCVCVVCVCVCVCYNCREPPNSKIIYVAYTRSCWPWSSATDSERQFTMVKCLWNLKWSMCIRFCYSNLPEVVFAFKHA